MSLIKFIPILLLFFLLSACGEDLVEEPSDSNENPSTEEQQPEENIEEPEEVFTEPELIQFSSYFMQDGATATYLGDGNEYASYQARTQWHNDNTVSIYEDNGGTTLLRTYRISDESIDLIQEQGEFYDEFNPTDEELQELPILSTFLKLPLEAGEVFDDWEIISSDQTLETPYQLFEQVIVLEKTDDTGAIQRKYIVEQYGEIKREFIMLEEDTEFIVTSTLESVE
ncbi:MAG TPA: hypothetical protein VLQ66_06400 [Paenisporosarcina sp.]|nr:hypothetical protein [Paenisporosarcina sp.]